MTKYQILKQMRGRKCMTISEIEKFVGVGLVIPTPFSKTQSRTKIMLQTIVEFKIDYMQFTTDLPASNKEREHELKRSFMQNYKTMRQFESGMTSHHGHNKSDKWLNIATGIVCDKIENHRDYIKNVLQLNGTFSRIDFCCTVENGCTMNDFRKWCKNKLISGTLADTGIKSIVNDDTENAETTYIGDLKKRSKRGIFRAYDKAIELGIEDAKLTRFELEERKKRAHTTARRFADGMHIGDIIRQRVDVDNDIWREIMGQKSSKLTRYTPQETNEEVDKTWHWLIDTCAKTLGQKMALDQWNERGDGNYDLFMKQVEMSYNSEVKNIVEQYKNEYVDT